MMREKSAQFSVVSCQCGRRTGFTLTEILVVIGIIVLLLALAVPAFNIMRGSRSVEGAENQLNAMMARSRTEAIGYQRTSGLFFFIDPRTPDQISCAAVQQVPVPSGLVVNREVYLDLVPERDFLLLPPGVGLQLVDDCLVLNGNGQPGSGVRADDGYIGYNTTCQWNGANQRSTSTPYGGVILFDANGRLMSVTYGFRVRNDSGINPPTPTTATQMGDLLYFEKDAYQNPNRPNVPGVEFVEPGAAKAGLYPRSQFGLVLYDWNAFTGAQGTLDDPQLNQDLSQNANLFGTLPEAAEEKWLDANATPLLANRYTGTLSRAGS